MVELASAQDEGVAVFRMTSRHHGCQIDADRADQRLDPGEQRLGLAPVWLDLDVAVEGARRAADRPDAPRWVLREQTVLELLAAEPT